MSLTPSYDYHDPAYLAAVRGIGGGVRTTGRVAVLHDGVQVSDTYYGTKVLGLLSASVRCDRLAESRRSFRAEFEIFLDQGFDYTDPLQKYTFVPYIGVETTDTVFWVPQGEFSCTDLDQSSSTGRQTVSVTMVDMSTRYRENPWKTTKDFTGDPFTYGDAIRAILTERAPVGYTPIILGDFEEECPKPLIYSADEDPWAAVWKLAQSAGGEVYYDRESLIRMRYIQPVTSLQPSLEILSGEYNVLDGEISRQVRRSEVFNGVICRGSAPWLLFPISGEVWDEDPLSHTWREGPFGERPKKIEDAVASSDAQCEVIAQAEFERVAGRRQAISMSVLKDPTLEVGSVLRVAQGGLVEGLYMIDSTDLDMIGMTMNIAARKRA